MLSVDIEGFGYIKTTPESFDSILEMYGVKSLRTLKSVLKKKCLEDGWPVHYVDYVKTKTDALFILVELHGKGL